MIIMRMYNIHHSIDCLTSEGAKINVNSLFSKIYSFSSFFDMVTRKPGLVGPFATQIYTNKYKECTSPCLCALYVCCVYKKQLYRACDYSKFYSHKNIFLRNLCIIFPFAYMQPLSL